MTGEDAPKYGLGYLTAFETFIFFWQSPQDFPLRKRIKSKSEGRPEALCKLRLR